jgi:hypothetical protein
MKKMVTMTLVTAISTLLLVGCNTTTDSVAPEQSFSGGYETPLPAHTDKRKVHNAVMEAGNDSGWIMTEFKPTIIIAEKIVDGKSASATISFGQDKLIIVQENSTLDSKYKTYVDELQDVIYEKLQSESSH